MPGERLCGDQLAVVRSEERLVLALADGLGHGEGAHEAATAAMAFVNANAGLTPGDMLRGCDRAIAHTRGVALTVLALDLRNGELLHAAVGNVEVRAVSREPIRPLPQQGVLGVRVRRIVENRYRTHPGDLIVLFTDGISSRADLDPFRTKNASAAARLILETHAKDHDDAACLVLKC